MKWVVRAANASHEVEVERVADGYVVTVDGRPRQVDLSCVDGALASLRFTDTGRSFPVAFQRRPTREWRIAVGLRGFDITVLTPVEAVEATESSRSRGGSRVEAPIPGKVVAVKVKPEDVVEPGQPLVVLEAMKMENELVAEQAGRVAVVHVEPGTTVDSGTLLVELE